MVAARCTLAGRTVSSLSTDPVPRAAVHDLAAALTGGPAATVVLTGTPDVVAACCRALGTTAPPGGGGTAVVSGLDRVPSVQVVTHDEPAPAYCDCRGDWHDAPGDGPAASTVADRVAEVVLGPSASTAVV